MKNIFSAFGFACVLSFSVTALFAQQTTLECYQPDPGGRIREHNIDFEKLDLFVQFKPQQKQVIGKAEYIFHAMEPQVDSVFLDGPGIIIDNIQLDKSNTRFKTDSAGTTVFFNPPLLRNQQHTLSIEYSCYPKKGIYFVGWNESNTDNPNDPTIIRKQIWTQGQGVDNRFWIPSYDATNDKLISALHIQFDSSYTVVSNGELKQVSKNNDGTKTWYYAMPHPHAVYLIMLAVGKYDVMEFTSKNGITTRQYYYPGTKDYAENTYRYTPELMDWLDAEIGFDYPWTTYANVPVQEFLYGAMENTTATIFSDFFYQLPACNPDKQYVEINAHELTHQWFGDYVTAWSGASHWLQESFATYYAKKFAEHINGDDYYNWKRREEMLTAINADNNGDNPVGHSAAGSALVYQKGSFVLDMLRYVAGDAAFKIAITEYLQRNPYANVQTQDLEMQFMRSLGMDMHWFFDEWIYRDGYPVYAIKWDTAGTSLNVHVSQTQQQTGTIHLFDMPVHIQVHYQDGSFEDKLVRINTADTTVHFTTEKRDPAFVLFDPNTMILSRVDFPKSYTELKWQAFNAPNMMDRYDAIAAMDLTDIETKRDDLIKLYNKEKFHAIKSEIIDQLAQDDTKASLAVLRAAVYDTDPLVRRAVLIHLDTLPKKLKDDIPVLLKDDNYTNIELALRRLAEWDSVHVETYLKATNGNYGATNNVRIAWLEIMNKTHANAQITPLVAFCGPQYEFRTRVAAFNAISNLNYCDATTVAYLYDALINSNHRLSNPARNTLNNLKKTPVYAEMIRSYYSGRSWSEWEQRRIGTVKD